MTRDREDFKRIGIDAQMVGTSETGNETYVRGLICGLRASDDRNASS